jgi:hypothetical protein
MLIALGERSMISLIMKYVDAIVFAPQVSDYRPLGRNTLHQNINFRLEGGTAPSELMHIK